METTDKKSEKTKNVEKFCGHFVALEFKRAWIDLVTL